jgi:C4-dicarboxylate-specific signal transduction histidine kinase
MIGLTERVLAIVAVVGWLAALVLGGALWVQDARHASVRDQLERAVAARDAAVQSATAWERAAQKLRADLARCVEEREVDRARAQQAVAAAMAARRDADRTLNAWLDRYRAATASAECAAIERATICPVAP